MIDGAVAWHKTGLAPPPAVVSASQAYFAEEDRIGLWLDECCETGSGYSAPSSTLFTSWKYWAESANEPVGSHKGFSQSLEERGFDKKRDNTGKVMFLGLRQK
jgi:putative DNA primase/helicase